LSLLPIGLVTILQTRELAAEVRSNSELSVLNMTNRAIYEERQLIERVFGAAEALTATVELLREDPAACRAYLQRYVEKANRFSFVGFVPPSGVMTCSSVDGVLDFSDDPRLEDRMSAPRALVERLETPGVSTEPVLSVLRPAYDPVDGFVGYVTLSVPVRLGEASEERAAPPTTAPSSVVTFNREGGLLLSQAGPQRDDPRLPEGLGLADLAGSGPRAFDARDQNGRQTTFAVVPIIPDLVYAAAAWPAGPGAPRLAGMPLSPILLPLLMFTASIAVAYLAVDRLVVRHVSELRRMMRAFARGRTLPRPRRGAALSTELRELEEGFLDMAIDLANDEARMEDALREKNVLLKEIHHRVKNNLQLISSIMNMQIRAAREEETVSFLRRLQERVLGLAAVHRNLYQADDLSRTDGGKLLEDLFGQLLTVSPRRGDTIEFRGDFDQIVLYPDQALPLSLLASELGTNALDHVSAPEGEPCIIAASLKSISEDEAELVCENSVDPDAPPRTEPGHGLGTRLIRAFAAQLGGKVTTEELPRLHRVTLRFKLEAFPDAPGDY
jgi:two-component sensor histidine kinase